MSDRTETITAYFYGEAYTQDYFKDIVTNYIIPEALAETAEPDEGDYLRYIYGGMGYKAAIQKDESGELRYYTITFTPRYYTTYAQEQEMDALVSSLLDSFAFSGSDSEYQKIYRIYDYICRNVTYDNTNLNDDSYTLKYTAYAALHDKTAVCQGYASLFYRLLRETGINVRVATGYGGAALEDASSYVGNHAWNIVQIDGKWYYSDSTWDANYSDAVAAGTSHYQYFLKGTSDFDTLEAPYNTDGIHYLLMDQTFTDTYTIEETKYTLAPTVSLALSANGSKIRMSGVITNADQTTEHGFLYITKARLGARSLTVNSPGRTKVKINGINQDGSYAYSMTPKSPSTQYIIRAYVAYKNKAGKIVYVYSDAMYVSRRELS